MLLLIVLGWLFAWRERRRAQRAQREYARRRVRERRDFARALKDSGWDVMPAALIGVEGPVLRDTRWNRLRQDLGHVPGEPTRDLFTDAEA
jgi:hypothetical protein